MPVLKIVVVLLVTCFYASASYAQRPLPRDYLGIKLGMTVEEVKAKLPLTCIRADDSNQTCHYSGSTAANAIYGLLRDLTELVLHFDQEKLDSIMADHDGESFADILAFSKLAYGEPSFDVQNVLGMIREERYTWQDQETESALWYSTGRDFYGKPVNAWVGVIRNISATSN